MFTFISSPFKYIISMTAIFILVFSNQINAKELFDSWDDLTLVGGFTVPATLVNGYNTRYASGSFDKLPRANKWIAQHGGVSGYIVEYTEPSEPSMSFPTLTYTGRYGEPFTTVEHIKVNAVQWIDADRVICSGAMAYRHPSTYNWVSIWSLDTGVETLQTVCNVDGSDDWAEGRNSNYVWYTQQAYGGGFSRIPSDWATANGLTGKTIGMMAGGRKSNQTSMGPTAAAFAVGDTLPSTLMGYPGAMHSSDGGYHMEIRDKNYLFPTYYNGNTASPVCPDGADYSNCNTPIPGFVYDPDIAVVSENPRISGPTGATGYFTADVVSHGAGWIDDANYKGVVYGVLSPNGYLDYDTQDVGFLVWDPSTYYDGSTAHYYHPKDYANGPAGSWSIKLYIYDPDEFAQVKAGTKKEWECTPTIITPDFSNLPISPINRAKEPTEIGGVFWDNDRGYLWFILTQMSSNNRYPLMVAYELKKPPRPPIGLKIETE